jgi:hypothetical protein
LKQRRGNRLAATTQIGREKPVPVSFLRNDFVSWGLDARRG